MDRRTFHTTIGITLPALALLASPVSAKKSEHRQSEHRKTEQTSARKTEQASATLWATGASVTLRDFTDPQIFGDSVETRAALWNARLPDGTSFVYVREVSAPCDQVIGADLRASTAAQLVPAGEVWVCSQKKLAGAYGETVVDRYTGGPLYGGYIRLRELGSGNRKEKLNTVCHELGHALGVGHNDSSHSCLSSSDLQTTPGSHDRAQLASS